MKASARSRSLPDVAQDQAALARTLDWVGMDGIALPLMLDGGDDPDVGDGGANSLLRVPAEADIAVDLADADARGIHMSRLYLLLQQGFADTPLCAQSLRALLQACIDSQNGASTRARVCLRYDQLLLRPALASANAGWKQYPVAIEATLDASGLRLQLDLSLDYSSTCPASTALSRQINAERFVADFADVSAPSTSQVHDWLASPRGMAATPHAQRSRAYLRIRLRDDIGSLDVGALVDAVEEALATPVQTAVKREDEQAFAERNAANLMFCEDAARRIAAVLSRLPGVVEFQARAAHLESLHAHDAVARVSGRGPG
ncbi:MAG: GTP cyclohydrolase FolE2 [Pseudoxanthomonas suwonensis]|nr:GTP cyclohydrolase FolE2 [Pseudoxanthomonas suwonensis]